MVEKYNLPSGLNKIEKGADLQVEEITEIEEAKEKIEELIKSGVKPTVTVPEEYIELVRSQGLRPTHQADKSGKGEHYSILAATLGMEPFFNAGEERWVIEIDPKGLKIEPRFTGQNKSFKGVIAITGGVPSDALTIIGKFDKAKYQNFVNKETHP